MSAAPTVVGKLKAELLVASEVRLVLQNELMQAQTENERLKKALRRYAHHAGYCRNEGECNCGLETALVEGEVGA